jgi:hypothetical protein
MIRNVLTFSIALVACALMAAPSAQAQCDSCDGGGGRLGIGSRLGGLGGGLFSRGGGGGVGSYDSDGMIQPTSDFVSPMRTLKAAAHDNFSPHRVYSYSNAGLDAAHTHNWNNSQQDVHSWHGGYQNWRWESPTALVVPPTASYQSSYNWGVGQTRSTPIHHQFGRGGRASVGGGIGGGFQNTPYWPHSTDNFGLYPVRGPW